MASTRRAILLENYENPQKIISVQKSYLRIVSRRRHADSLLRFFHGWSIFPVTYLAIFSTALLTMRVLVAVSVVMRVLVTVLMIMRVLVAVSMIMGMAVGVSMVMGMAMVVGATLPTLHTFMRKIQT